MCWKARRTRETSFDYKAFDGKGQIPAGCSIADEPAWEEPGTGHGLLTGSIIEVLTAGTEPIDIAAAVAEIAARTRDRAKAIGEEQSPCFVGGIEGKLELPVLQRGTRWRSLFPDLQGNQDWQGHRRTGGIRAAGGRA